MNWVATIGICLALVYLRLITPILLKEYLKENQNDSEER